MFNKFPFHKFLSCLFIFIVFQIQAFAQDFVYKKLDSGQVVIVKEMRENPIVTINTWVKTGSINEDDNNSGVAHFLEHLFFKGSKNVPSGQFDKILESKGALTNAATSKDYTQFYITIPSKDFDTALKLNSDILLNPLIPRKELEKERLVVLEEISRGLDSPSNILYTNLFKLIYQDYKHPYMRPVIGSKEIISSISRDGVLDFYNEWYTPDNMITIVSGDVDSDYAIKEVQKAFEREPVKHNKKVYPQIQPISKQMRIKEEKDIAQGHIAIAYKAPKFTNAKETYALDVLSVILGGSNSSILTTELKEKHELVNSIGSSYSQYLDDGLFIISASFKPEKLKSVENEIFNEINKLKQGSITKEQVQKAKNILKTSTMYSRESVSNIAEELGFFTFYLNTPVMYDEYLDKIDKITVKDVVGAANKFLDNNKTAISTVMPKGFVEISNVAAAAKIVPDSAKIVEQSDNVTKYLLDNGATLIIKKNKQNSIIAFNIYAKGGSFLSDKMGVPYLAAKNAPRGTRKFSHDELNDFLDDNGIRLSLSSNPDAFNIAMQLTKNRQELGFMILDEIVNYPTFPTNEIEKTKKNYKEYVKSLKERSLALANDDLVGVAFVGYPYSNNNQKTVKVIDSITRAEIIGFYEKVLDAKNLVITVVGDVQPEKMIKEFNRIFEDKGNNAVEVKNFLKQNQFDEKNYVKKIPLDGKETSWILVAYKTCPIYDIKEVAVLRVIDSLMGTGMSSRLFKSLRENQGLAYQVGSTIQQFANDGLYFAYIGTNPKNEEKALSGIFAEFDKLKTEFVSLNELKEAKDKLLGNMIIALETNMDRAEFLSRYEALGFDLDFLDKLKKEIENVSASDILSFANKYFSQGYFEIIVGK